MGTINYSWLQPSRIVVVEFSGDITVEELTDAVNTIVTNFLDSGTTPVHLIVDLRTLGTSPTNIASMRDLNSKVLKHPKFGWLIAVGRTTTVQRFTMNVVTQLLKVNFQQVDSLDEAVIILKKTDPTL